VRVTVGVDWAGLVACCVGMERGNRVSSASMAWETTVVGTGEAVTETKVVWQPVTVASMITLRIFTID
jgi:hypothetical protein